MRKKVWILTAALCFGLCTAVPYPEGQSIVRAGELSPEQAGKQPEIREHVSRGNMIYREDGEEVGIYEADFALLHEKLSAISGEVFDPAGYAHTHQWEYRDVDKRTHTRHCAICGDDFDMEAAHKAESAEDCTISCEGRNFYGRRYRCVCGYQWEKEAAHVLTFDMVDETCHRSRCLLDGTEYCPGYEPVEEEHYAYYYETDQTGTHRVKTCIDCGYQVEEELETDELTEITGGETAATEADVSSETAGEETETSQSDESSEITGEETAATEDDEAPAISVSGNDCPVEEMQDRPEETAEETLDEGGED